MQKIDLKGHFSFCLDYEKEGVEKKYYQKEFEDGIVLPATVASAKKVNPDCATHTGYLTDPYHYDGYTWYSKTLTLSVKEGKEYFLVLERTRISHIWIDDNYVGSNQSLSAMHRYRLTPYISSKCKLTIMIDNTSYPVPGGHMTSPDTQTNWNGITGDIYLEECSTAYLTGVKIFPDAVNKLITVKLALHGVENATVMVSVAGETSQYQEEYILHSGNNTFTYKLDETVKTWSEHTPNLYQLNLVLQSMNQEENDVYQYSFGLRDFRAAGKYFEINGVRTFLRGKHDGLIFPITAYAPTDVDSWLKVLGTAKEYGINHYRFHTCCPPKAAFVAADMIGIYMEPELPFWGTVTEEGEENHNELAQQYLIEEGFRILDEFGNHPSFTMMSLGNELWGSKNKLNQILKGYKEYDDRHLYTQGSNNFQFMPCVLENEDFFCGVRFSRDRLFRGSYAMCDAPQGHIQTMPPNMSHNYDSIIRPNYLNAEAVSGGEVTIQYQTGTKTVKVDASDEMIAEVPVVSHEVGQYGMYPDFSEIAKYTGVLKARNLDVFQNRLKEAGMLSKGESFFKASGRFAAECYKAEIETALRSNELAGFQLLDLQDFTGQGTALVGILNSFMESKGVIELSEWQQFCSDTVLLAQLPKLVFAAGESVQIGIKLATFRNKVITAPTIEFVITNNKEVVFHYQLCSELECANGVYHLGEVLVSIPKNIKPQQLKLTVKLVGTKVKNEYQLWSYPIDINDDIEQDLENKNREEVVITNLMEEAIVSLNQGKKVLLYPENLNDNNSVLGTYCTDFWNYPMFRSISESMGRPVPVGTHGLLIEREHAMFDYFPTECHSTPQWYDIVSNSRAMIIDGTEIEPVVWTIDNVERNHKLGTIFEMKVGEGKLVVCTANLSKLNESAPAKWLEYSILSYMNSEEFVPTVEMELNRLKELFSE